MRAAVVFIAAAVAVDFFALAPAGYAAGAIPVECGDTLDVPGGRYALTADLSCPDYSGIVITADDVRFDLSGFTISLAPGGNTSSSHAVRVGFVPGVGCVPTSGVRVWGGGIEGFSGGIDLCYASHTRVSDMRFIGNIGTSGSAISLWRSDDNRVEGVDIARSEFCGICIFGSSGNRISDVTVEDVFGAYPYWYGIVVWNSHENVISHSRVSNSGFGVQLQDSSRNSVEGNEVTGNAYGISVLKNSDDNVISRNRASGGGDGIYIGCCDVIPHFGPQRTVGADHNMVRLNTALGNARFGMAEVVGNEGNQFEYNESRGNEVANRWPPPALSALRPYSREELPAEERFRACADVWWLAIDTEFRAYQGPADVPELVQKVEELEAYVAANCGGTGAALATVPGAPRAWCGEISEALSAVTKLGAWPSFLLHPRVELKGFIEAAGCQSG